MNGKTTEDKISSLVKISEEIKKDLEEVRYHFENVSETLSKMIREAKRNDEEE